MPLLCIKHAAHYWQNMSGAAGGSRANGPRHDPEKPSIESQMANGFVWPTSITYPPEDKRTEAKRKLDQAAMEALIALEDNYLQATTKKDRYKYGLAMMRNIVSRMRNPAMNREREYLINCITHLYNKRSEKRDQNAAMNRERGYLNWVTHLYNRRSEKGPFISVHTGIQDNVYDERDHSEKAIKEDRYSIARVYQKAELQNLIVYWIDAAFYMGRQGRGNKLKTHRTDWHLMINVNNDGSCFYQCLAYALLWLMPTVEQVPKTLLDLKMDIIKRVYGVDITEKTMMGVAKDYLPEHEFRTHVNYGTQKTVVSDSTLKHAAHALGLVDNPDGATFQYTGVYADVLAIELASIAYGVQILIYEDETHGPDKMYNKDIVLQKSTARLLGVTQTEPFQDIHMYSGHPVVILLLDHGHYYLLSNFPYMDGMTSDGCGIKLRPVPETIEVGLMPQVRKVVRSQPQEPTNDLHPRDFFMPAVQKCVSCNKWISL